MQWNASYQESVFSFANNINTHEGGSHLSGFRSALTRTLNRYAREKGVLKEKDENLSGEDVREGLTAVISAKLADPQFEGQTKTKLGNPGMEGFVASVVNARARRVPRGEPGEATQVIRKAVSAAQARAAARKARDLTRASPRWAELGAARQARRLLRQEPRAHRAVHRRGRLRRRLGQAGPRPLDAGRPAAARQDPQRREGADRQGPAEQRDPGADHRARHRRARRVRPRAPRYHKIILMTDADVDGAHIRTLILTLLFREMQDLDRGRLRLHRQAAALQAQAGPRRSATSRRTPSSRRSCSATSSSASTSATTAASSSSSPRRAGSATAGCSSSTRAGRPRCAPSTATRSSQFLEESQILDEQVTQRSTSCSRCSARDDPEGEPYTTELVASDDGADPRQGGRAAARTSRARTGCAARCSTPTSTASSRACTRSSSRWPARRRSRSRSATRRTTRCRSRSCAARCMEVAAKGVKLQRFKGLGEMNAEQLRETTMDPASRTLRR